MTEITKDTVIGDILDICPDAAPYFLQMGMHCLGCPASRGETVEQACAVHGVDTDDLLEQINALLRDCRLWRTWCRPAARWRILAVTTAM